jgi:N-acetylmuramoyl-L-alanine amidase
MPAILTEVSCLSNENDATLLQRASYRQYIADALAQGISGFAEETSFRTEAGR